MPSLTKIKQVTEIALQQYPVMSARYRAGDPTVTAQISAIQHMLAEIGRDIDVSEIEPFVKSRESTILADASNKGILPWGTPCQHRMTINNRGTERETLSSGRIIEDGQGRPWRLLQNAEIVAGGVVQVLAEQSQVRRVERTIIETISFNQFTLDIDDDMSLVTLAVTDQDMNQYAFVTRWMNTTAGERAITLKTNSLREITLEFGDSSRFGRTLEANTSLSIDMIETYGEIDVTALKEAMLQEVNTSSEAKLNIRFSDDGMVRMGANPLTINQMRLLASYPSHDEDAVFLGNFEFSVRKKFMARCHYLNVWNENVHEQYFGANVMNINHLFVSVVPKHASEYDLICNEIGQFIGRVDNLYAGDKTVFIAAEERPFNIYINATLSAVHDVETVKEQIKTLLISNYGKEQFVTSQNLSNGFNLQEISKLISGQILAFQDRQSDFNISIEDTEEVVIKPNQWLYLTAESIHLNMKRSSGGSGGLWAVY